MTDGDDSGRPEPPLAGDEIATLLGSLERQRATFAWKVGGLGPAGLQARLGRSEVTLGGLIKHMAVCEDGLFGRKWLGLGWEAPWDRSNWEADEDWEWHSAAQDSPQELMALWQEAVARSRGRLAHALEGGGLDQLSPGDWPDDWRPSLRRLLVDFIEEYARHVGHADLLRESVDGLVGEDPPWPPTDP